MNGSSSIGTHECPVCSRRYERLDHLRRHALSHQNFRLHACPYCSRRFNRRDMLARHVVGHDPSDQRGPSVHSERAIQACKACVKSKAKCSNQRPCRRCAARHIQCRDSTPESASRSLHLNSGSMAEDLSSNNPFIPDHLAAQIPLQTGDSLAQTLLYQNLLTIDYPPSQDGFFYDRLRDTNWFNDPMFTNPGTHFQQSLGALELGLSELPSSPADSTFSAARNLDASSSQSLLTRFSFLSAFRHEAFKKSLWVWTPAREESCLDCHHLSVDETLVMQDREAKETENFSLKLPRITESGPRDGIFSLSLKFAGVQPSIESFPSLTIFNLLMQTFFVKEYSRVDTVVHPATFDPNQCRYDLLASIIGAGSTMFAVSSAQKLGLSLQEIVRRAISASTIEDNAITLNLQAIQTCFFCVEAGLWSGVKKKMEIAEGYAHVVPSMLRRAGAFRKSYYLPLVVPCHEDQGNELRQKWHKWVQQESFRRLVLRDFVHESRGSIAFGRIPLLCVSEITFALPASRDLWDAASPEEWKARYLAKPSQQRDISIIDVIRDRSRLDANKDVIDVNVTAHAILYALWGRTWLFLQSRSLATQPSSVIRTTSGLWIETQRQELYQDIQETVLDLSVREVLTPDGILFSELVMLYLYSSPEDMGRLAGRLEVDDFYDVLPALERWLHSEDCCRSVWHAGQILRAARSFPPAGLRGFYAIAVYQACLTLWVFVVLSGNAGTQMNVGDEPMIALDREETTESRLFLRSGRGCPCIHVRGQMTMLLDPQLIPTVMGEVLQGNFSSEGHPLPTLVEDLYSLIHNIARAQ